MAKSAREYLYADKQPKVVVLDKDFAGIKRGKKVFVATPKIIDDYIRAIPYGQTRSIKIMRAELALKEKCDATCPLSSAIFIRISTQAAIDELREGKAMNQVTPFWRLLSGEDKITKKLAINEQWLERQRQMEQASHAGKNEQRRVSPRGTQQG